MSAPFYVHGFFGKGISLLIALGIGILFGFFLERVGLGNASKLAGQFYFYDMIVFKMMFQVIKGISTVFKWFGLISNDRDLYSLQETFLALFIILDFIIDSILSIIKFVLIMGILWTIVLCEFIIFIYAYLTSKKDILETFKRFFEVSISFWTIIIINPSKWIFEKVIKIWT